MSLPPPTRHAKLCYRAASLIGGFVDEFSLGHLLVNQPTLQLLPDAAALHRPDIAYISFRRLPDESFPEGYLRQPPEAVWYVLMPGGDYNAIERQARELLTAGVQAVCLLDAETESAHVFRPQRDPHVVLPMRSLQFDDILPGWRVEVREFFA